jgi:hypothetical protein
MKPEEIYEVFRQAVIGAGCDIEETWEMLEDFERAGWEAVANAVALRLNQQQD